MSRAKKNRKKEQRHMDDFVPEMEPDGEYYSCSDTQEHSDSCKEIEEKHPAREFGYSRLYIDPNGKEVGCITVSKWDVAIAKERKKWKEMELDPGRINFTPLEMNARSMAIIDILVEHGFPEGELNTAYQKRMLSLMQQAREDITPSIQEMRRRAIVAPATGLTGPDGKPLKFN